MQEIILKLSLLGVAFTSSVIFLTFFTPFYHLRFEGYDVYEDFDEQWSREQIDNEFSDVQKYLLPFSDSDLNPDFFSQEDIFHMNDVKALYTFIYLILAISTISFIASLYLAIKAKRIIKIDKFELGLLIILIILFTITIISFSSLFETFHKVIFSNDYWLLDPESSNLIKYFPERLFLELTLLLTIISTVLYFILLKITTIINQQFRII